MSHVKRHHAFVNNFAKFNECFDIYCRGRFEQEESQVIRKLIKALTSSLVFQEIGGSLKVLSVRDGKFDILFIEELIKHTLPQGLKVTWTVIDPNRLAVLEFRKTLQAYDFEIPGVEFVWAERKFEEFVATAETKKRRYNLILFMNCLYYMNADYTIRKSCCNLLSQPGAIFLSEVGANNIAHQILKKFELGFGVMSAGDATRTAGKSFPLRKKKLTVDLKLDVTDLFHEESRNSANKLLQFILQSDKIDGQMEQEVTEFIQTRSWPEKNEIGEEMFMASNETTFFLVFN